MSRNAAALGLAVGLSCAGTGLWAQGRNVNIPTGQIDEGTYKVLGQQSSPVPATPQNAAAFLGEWTISAKGSYGDINATVVLKAADGKVAGEITDTNGTHQFGDISKSDESLVAYYRFDYNGMPIDAAVTLTPNAQEKRTDAYFDMANGAAQFAGTAVKK